jgi:hypothetical protein
MSYVARLVMVAEDRTNAQCLLCRAHRFIWKPLRIVEGSSDDNSASR